MKKIPLIVSIFILLLLALTQTVYGQEKQAGVSASLDTIQISLERDNRVIVLREFLKSYESPLADNAETFVKEADKNNIDWRLVAAISGVESTFAHQLPAHSYNAWGWGIYGDNVYYFRSYDDAISTISAGLRQHYIDKWGAQNVYEIGRFYAASPTWAQRVDLFMKKIELYSQEVALQKLSISI